MKAVVLHEYGGPSKLKYEDFADPTPGPGELLVHILAASINPIDWKMRSGDMKASFPLTFPAILGRDCAGTVLAVGEGVTGFKVGDKVFAATAATYAELCVVKAAELSLIPEGLDLTTAAAVPLVALTGDQLIRDGAKPTAGQTILLTGALGSVGRIALYCAVEMGVKVIAGVRKHQLDEALALGATAAVDLNDDKQLAALGLLDAVADTVGHSIATALLVKVKPGGNFGSVLGPVAGSDLHPTIHVNMVGAHPHPPTVVHYGEAIRDGKLKLPIDRIIPLTQAAEGQTAAEKGGIGKVILTP